MMPGHQDEVRSELSVPIDPMRLATDQIFFTDERCSVMCLS
jgi:hypothetical protein